jgi:hypothetical protein
MRRELGRIDEDRDNDAVGLALRTPDQCQMTGMQGPHCRHQGDPLTAPAPFGENAAERRLRADNLRMTGLGPPRGTYDHGVASPHMVCIRGSIAWLMIN